MNKPNTMAEVYNYKSEISNHLCCPNCGCCIDCGDCNCKMRNIWIRDGYMKVKSGVKE